VLRVAIDLNVFLDLESSSDRRGVAESRALTDDWLADQIELVVTAELAAELARLRSFRPGDSGALLAGCRARPAPAASQRPVPFTPHLHPTARLLFTRHQRRFTRFTRPACPSPVTPDGTAALGLFPVLRTPPLPAAHDRAGPGVSTRPELRDRHNRPSNQRVHSLSATSCRNGRSAHSRSALPMHKHTIWPRACSAPVRRRAAELGDPISDFGHQPMGDSANAEMPCQRGSRRRSREPPVGDVWKRLA